MNGRVERVGAAVTRPLRQRVLRPHQTLEELVYAGDDDPAAGHFAAFAPDGTVIGTGTVHPEAPPWDPAHASAWRLRGMATADGWRSQGVGAAVLAAVMDHVRSHGGTLLWCYARVPAVPFYERSGFASRGEPWEEPHIGPHIAMETDV